MKALFLKKWKGIKRNSCLTIHDITDMIYLGRSVKGVIVQNEKNIKIMVPIEIIEMVPDMEKNENKF